MRLKRFKNKKKFTQEKGTPIPLDLNPPRLSPMGLAYVFVSLDFQVFLPILTFQKTQNCKKYEIWTAQIFFVSNLIF